MNDTLQNPAATLTAPEKFPLPAKVVMVLSYLAFVALYLHWGDSLTWSSVWHYLAGSTKHDPLVDLLLCPLTDVCTPIAR